MERRYLDRPYSLVRGRYIDVQCEVMCDTENTKTAIILSIKPHWGELILSGKKRIELRRRFTHLPTGNVLAVLYASAPTKAVIGTVQITGVKKASPQIIWKEFSEECCVEAADFYSYFSNSDGAVAIKLHNPTPTTPSIPLEDLREKCGFAPPMSWRWAKIPELEMLGCL